MFKKILSKSTKFARISLSGILMFYGYHGYHHLVNKPSEFDFGSLKEKDKTIVVIGSGMVGLTTAYYLSNHPQNKVIVLERNKEPYKGTSKQNGSWLPIDHCSSWTNKPFYPFLYKSIFQSDQYFSKTYCNTLFQNVQSFLIMSKFAFFWAFYQPDSLRYSRTELTLYQSSLKLLNKLIKDEQIDEKNDLGYFDNAKIIYMKQNSSSFQEYLHSIQTILPNSEIIQISRQKNPNEFKSEIDDKFGSLVPEVKNYTDALFRQMNILDTSKLGSVLYGILAKRQNVQFLFDAKVSSYDIQNNKLVDKVNLENGEKIDCDVVVICNGPQAPFHISDCLKTILPSIQAQGYCFNLIYEDLSKHTGMSLRLTESPYSYCHISPGKARLASCVDFGVFYESFFDKERWNYIKQRINLDFGIPFHEIDSKVDSLVTGLRPMSPDNLPQIGPMKYYPNIILNVAYGPQGFQSLTGSKIVENIIENNKENEKLFDKEFLNSINCSRMFV